MKQEIKKPTAMDLYNEIKNGASDVYAQYVVTQVDNDLRPLAWSLGATMLRKLKVLVLAEVVQKINHVIELANQE